MDKDGAWQCNFFIARFCWISVISCSAKKMALSYFEGLKNGWFLQRHFSIYLFTDKKFLKEGIFAVVMLLHLEGKLLFFFVR